jgi:hypothetical protein
LFDNKQLHKDVECAGGVSNYKNVKDGPPFAGIEFNDGGDEETGEKNIKEVISSECGERAAEVHPCIEFNDSRDDDVGEEDIKVGTVNITVNEMISGESAEGAT